jgi:hypothetical protein
MMGHKDKLKFGVEWDVIYFRNRYCYLVNHGKNPKKFAKNQINKRNRKKHRQELKIIPMEN